jgi:hypothetical protein
MKNFDWKLWIIGLVLSSCGASHKIVNINKAHVDSSVIEKVNKTFTQATDSVSHSEAKKNYEKQTDFTLVPVELDSNEMVPPGTLVIKNKVTGKQTILVPKMSIHEWGNIAAATDTHVQKKSDSAVNQQKDTKVISDKKQVEKEKDKSGFNYLNLLWLLLLVPIYLAYKKLRKWPIF